MYAHTPPEKAPVAVPVSRLQPCPFCAPLDPTSLAVTEKCDHCNGSMTVRKVIGYVGKAGARA